MPALATLDIQALPRDVDFLLSAIAELHTQYSTILESMRQSLATLRRQHFGASSEKLPGQGELFTEVVNLPSTPPEEIEVKYKRQRRGRPALPKDLPRTQVHYDLSEAEKGEFDRLERIGADVSETIEYTPAKLTVIEHVRAKYVCHKDGESTIRTAFAQPSPLPKSNAGASLLAQILVATFADHLPLNRQERMFRRHGVELPRSTLCEWKLAAGELLDVLRAPLIAHALAAPRLHVDDTTLPLLERTRRTTKTARLWGYLGAGARKNDEDRWVHHPPAVVFEFTLSREALHPLRFLKGYRGYRRRSLKAIVGQVNPAFNFDDVHRRVLDEVIEHFGLGAFNPDDRDSIWRTWHALNAWPGFPAALARLKRKYLVASFTLLTTGLVIDVSRKNGFDWDAIISCEMIGVYKTRPEAYLTAAKWLQLPPGDIVVRKNSRGLAFFRVVMILSLPGQALRARRICNRLCSMLKSTHSVVRALNRL